MLPFSGLILPSPASSALVTDFGLGALYQHNKGTSGGGLASVILTIKTDGTWEITFAAGASTNGTPLTGTWLEAGGVASDYELKLTPSAEANAPDIVNDAAAYTTVSADLSISVSRTNADASATVTVELRNIAAGTPVLTDSASFEANGTP